MARERTHRRRRLSRALPVHGAAREASGWTLRESYERAQSEDVIRKLKEQGVEVFHTHLYKGFGMAAEMPGMEDAKRTAEIAHRHGLKVDSYIQWNTMMYETFFAEEPRAKDWIQRDALGQPILLVYGFQQSYRYRPCFANQEYLDYLKKIVRYAVEEVKTDFIHFDNFDLNAEPDSCHDSTCVRGFREFLKTKYTPARRKERFGFENVDYVNPPQWNAQNPAREPADHLRPGHPGMDRFPLPGDGRRAAADGRVCEVAEPGSGDRGQPARHHRSQSRLGGRPGPRALSEIDRGLLDRRGERSPAISPTAG